MPTELDPTNPVEETSEGDGKNTTGSGAAVSPNSKRDTTEEAGEEKPIFTQAQLDKHIQARLADEQKRRDKEMERANEEAERKRLAEQGEYKALLDRSEARVKELEAQVSQLELDKVRAKVGAKHSLPADLVDLLMGATEDELEKHAARLVKHLAPPRSPELDRNPRPNSAATREQEIAAQRATGRYGF